MSIIQAIFIIVCSAGSIVLMFFLFKFIYKGKLKSAARTIENLTGQVNILSKEKESLKKKIDQMSREKTAGISHSARVQRTEEETKTLVKKINKAKTDDQIMDILSYIDEGNNKVLKK